MAAGAVIAVAAVLFALTFGFEKLPAGLVGGFGAEAFPRLVLGVAHLLGGRPADAIRELEVASALGTLSHVRGFLGYSYALGGQRQSAETIAQELDARTDADSRAALAVTQIALGDTARALRNLEVAAQGHAAFFTAQPLSSPVFDPVRASPRFQTLLATLGLK